MILYLIFFLPLASFLVAAFFLHRSHRYYALVVSVLTACFGQIFAFIAWLFSRREVDFVALPNQIPDVMFVAGFPLHGLRIPPFAGGFRDIQDLDVIVINQLFWFFIGFLFALWAAHKMPKGWWKESPIFFLTIAVVAMFMNLLLIVLWFD